MKKILKACAIVVGVLLLIAIIIPLVLRGRIGDIVKREANSMLSAEVDFDRLGISLLRHFPKASLELLGLTVAGTGEFEGDTLASMSRLSVVVDVMSLFGDSFEVTRVILDDPAVKALKHENGAVNWDVMKPSEEAAAEENVAEGGSSFAFSMKDVRINNATVSFVDDSSRTMFCASDLDLRLRGDMSADRSDLKLLATVGGIYFASDGRLLVNNAEVEVEANVEADFVESRYTLRENRLRVNAMELALDGWVAATDESILMDLKANSSKIGFRDILSMIPAFYTRDFRDLAADGEMSLDMWARGEMKGESLPAFSVDLNVRNGSFKYAALPAGVKDINVAANVRSAGGPADNTVVDLSNLSFSLAGNVFALKFCAATPVSDMSFTAAAKGRIDLGAVKDVYPLGDSVGLGGVFTADVKASGRMSDIEKERYEKVAAEGLSLELAGLPAVEIDRAAASITPAAMTLSELNVKVGRSDLKASGNLGNYMAWFLRGDKLTGRLDVASSLLDLNELMSGAGPGPESQASAASSDTVSLKAVAVPENLDLAMTASAGRILFADMTIDDFRGDLSVSGGVLRLGRLGMRAFGGDISASGSYDTSADPSQPLLKMSADISNASFSETFRQLDVVRKMVPIFEKTGGDYSMTLDLTTRLDSSLSPQLNTLSADGTISSNNVELQNLKVFEALSSVLGSDRFDVAAARDLRISFTVKDGRINTAPFDLKLGSVAMRLSGSTGLDSTIDYTARVSMPEGTAGGYVKSVGVSIGGTFSSPKVSLDMKQAASDAVTAAAGKLLGKIAGGSAADSTATAGSLSGQAEKLRAEARAAGDKLVSAAKEQGQKLVDAAKNPIAKLAAQKSVDALVRKAEEQAAKLMSEAEAKIAALEGGSAE